MFVLRLGSKCSLQLHTENMPPSKKLKTSDFPFENEIQTASRTENDFKQDLGTDWREDCVGVRSVNRYALTKNILTDVTFIVGEESVVCHAHRLILALGSPVFEAMFYGTLAERGDSITIPDVDPDAFQILLRFLYSEDVLLRNDVVAFKTYFAADKYCVTHLKKKCELYLCKCELMPSNVWVFLESSLYLNSQGITDRCFCFLKYNAETALQHSSFLDIGAKTIETLLSLDFLNVTEIKLLLNVIRWAEHKSSTEQGVSFQNIFMPLLHFIRFGALTATQFIGILETERFKNLLKDSHALAILKHIIQPLSCPLPDWCCTKAWRNHILAEKKCKRGSESIPGDKSKTEGKERFKSKSGIHFFDTSSSNSSSSSSSYSSSSVSDSEVSSYC